MKRIAMLFCILAASTALAGPLEEKQVEARLKAIAAGDVETLMRDYAEDASLDWIGGPLDGRYRGKKAILEVWRKWVALNDGKPRLAHFGKQLQHANPKGLAIEASAEYSGKIGIKVWHVFVYREGELVTELWQIVPALKVEE